MSCRPCGLLAAVQSWLRSWLGKARYCFFPSFVAVRMVRAGQRLARFDRNVAGVSVGRAALRLGLSRGLRSWPRCEAGDARLGRHFGGYHHLGDFKGTVFWPSEEHSRLFRRRFLQLTAHFAAFFQALQDYLYIIPDFCEFS